MPLNSFTSVTDGVRAIQDFLYDRDAALPDDLREKLRLLISPATSPVDAIAYGAELMYARKDELPAEAQELAAGLALLGQQFNFHGLAVDNRGSKMALSFMREAKVSKPSTISYPAKSKDPEPKDEFVPVPLVEVAEVEDTPPSEGARRGRGRRNRNAVNTS